MSNTQTTQEKKELLKGFFEVEISNLPKGRTNKEVKEELLKYSPSQFRDKDDKGYLTLKIEEFRGVYAKITRSVSKSSGLTFFRCELLLGDTVKHVCSSNLFTEDVYQELLLTYNDILSTQSEILLPVRIRLGVGKSEKVLNADKVFRCVDIIFPGIKRVYRDFLSESFVSRVNLLSVKSDEECKKQQISTWNKSFKLYEISDDVRALWDLEQPE